MDHSSRTERTRFAKSQYCFHIDFTDVMAILANKFHNDSPATTSAINTNILVSARKEIAKLDLFKPVKSLTFSHQMKCSPKIQRYLKSHSAFIDSSCIKVKYSIRLKRHFSRYQQTPASTKLYFFYD